MTQVRLPRDVLAGLVRAGRLKMGKTANVARVGFVMRAANTMAASGLEKAAEAANNARPLQFPPVCCNCLAERGVRPIESRSTVNKGVDYLFRLPIPHCRACADTANRQRPGAMGLTAAFLAISVPVGIVMLAFGAASNRDWLIMSSLVVAPLAGFFLPRAWMAARRPGKGQSSRYQAVYASGVNVTGSGVVHGFTLAFENPAYARQFLALNRDAGVKPA